jgi:TonB-linked SusC/RagA family outer membrane protein
MGELFRLPKLLAALVAVGTATVLAAPDLSAQATGTVQGTVTESGSLRPLPNIQVFVPSVGRGTLTNGQGRFMLVNVPAGQVQIQAQGVGYATARETVNLAAGQTATVALSLQASAIALDEVVVTGAGQATEVKKLGNTVATIDTKEVLATAPVNTVSEVLQGREPGVTGLPTGGLVGQGAKIRIRGSSSLTQSNEPIVYVDGVRVDSYQGFGPNVGSGGGGTPSRLDDINPEAIERIEILKGAAAATLYGTEASNGVIQIFTKKGAAGAPRWDFRAEYGVSKFPHDRFEPHAGFVRTQADADRVAAFWGLPGLQPFEPFEVDLVGQMFETGQHQAYSLSVNGGSDNITYFVSGRLTDDDGPFGAPQWGPTQDLNNKKQANATIAAYPFDNLQLRVNSMYVETHHEIPATGNNTNGTIPMVYMSKPEFANEGNPTGMRAFTTARETQRIETWNDVQRFAGGVTAAYSPYESLTTETTFGIDMVNQEAFNFRPFGWNVDGVSGNFPQGQRTASDRNFRQVTLDSKASWSHDINDSFSSALVIGGQGIVSRTRIKGGRGAQFPAPGLEVIEAGAEQSVFESALEQVSAGVYAQEQIGFNDYAFVTVGARYDKHSAFGEATGGAIYPKISGSLVFSDMPGWSEPMGISAFRVRGAIGTSGLQPGAFDKFTTFEPQGYLEAPGVAPLNLGNDQLKPEVSTEWEAGAELGLLDNRLALEATYWNRTVDDLLVARQFVPSGGFLQPQLDNVGQMQAQGLELGARGFLVNTPNFSLNLFANGSYIREEVTSLGGAPPIKVEYYRYRTWIVEGFAPGAFFGPKTLDAEFPFDTNRDGQPDSREQILAWLSQPRNPDAIPVMTAEPTNDQEALTGFYLGKSTPDWAGAFGAEANFLGNFQINTLFEYKSGLQVQNLIGAFREAHAALGRNTPRTAQMEATLLNPASTAEQRLGAAQLWARELKGTSPAGLNEVHDADFIRWRELSLTYNVPASFSSRFGADNLAVTFSGRNIALWTKYPGVDPEVNVSGAGGEGDAVSSPGSTQSNNFVNGVDAWNLPIPRRFSLAVRLGF